MDNLYCTINQFGVVEHCPYCTLTTSGHSTNCPWNKREQKVPDIRIKHIPQQGEDYIDIATERAIVNKVLETKLI